MRLVAIALIALLFAPCLRAEQATEDSAARRQLADRGTRKVTIGIGLLAAGAFVLPITSEGPGRWRAPITAKFVGLGLVAAGMGFTVSGLRDRERSVRPSVTVTGAVGPRKVIQISRTW